MEAYYEKFNELGIRIIAGNTEGDSGTSQTHADHDLSFPIAHSVSLEIAETLGAWTGVRKGVEVIQPCEFLLRPEGTVAASMYATTQLGRMLPEAIWHFVKNRI
ncbi:MAG: redoxin domain-containing protein [Chloroflexi bacterium]|nr:redoxin domain-containing protein [Chloroflexota bacterium]